MLQDPPNCCHDCWVCYRWAFVFEIARKCTHSNLSGDGLGTNTLPVAHGTLDTIVIHKAALINKSDFKSGREGIGAPQPLSKWAHLGPESAINIANEAQPQIAPVSQRLHLFVSIKQCY
jgi:hypothetical protein